MIVRELAIILKNRVWTAFCERLLTSETLLKDAADSKGVETAKNELELVAETEGTVSSLSVIIRLVHDIPSE